jgi:hypothetical protein
MTVDIPGNVPAAAERLGAVVLDVNVAPGHAGVVEMIVLPNTGDAGVSVLKIRTMVRSSTFVGCSAPTTKTTSKFGPGGNTGASKTELNLSSASKSVPEIGIVIRGVGPVTYP